jgi:hypothetical protein
MYMVRPRTLICIHNFFDAGRELAENYQVPRATPSSFSEKDLWL